MEKTNNFFAFLKRKDIEISFKRYFLDAFGAMALGLFASLLIGAIFSSISLIHASLSFFNDIGVFAKTISGAAMAVAIAYALKAPPLVLFSAAAVGYAANSKGGAGGPIAVLLIAIVAVEVGKMVSKETKVDILVTPFVTIFVGGGLAVSVAPLIAYPINALSGFISWSTELQPFLMGIIIAVVIGMALTLPISSAAICLSIGLSGYAASDAGLALAGGAAIAGCCAQMVGFAVMSFRENRWGGLVSQGIGTSMLQMPNIIKNPRIWIPPTVAAAITGPIATCLFKMQMYDVPINSGMGTCALLGPLGMVMGWFGGKYPGTVGAFDWIGLLLVCFILPAAISLGLCELLRRIGWIKENDLKL